MKNAKFSNLIRICLSLLFCMVMLNNIKAQSKRTKKESKEETVGIYLNNGSVIIGKELSSSSKKTELKIEGGEIVSLYQKDIKKVKRSSDGFAFTKNGNYNFDKGFYFSIYPVIGLYGKRRFLYNSRTGGVGIKALIGRHHNKRLSYGLGIGYFEMEDEFNERYSNYNYRIFPVITFVNYNINLNGPRVYLTAKIGYAIKNNFDPSEVYILNPTTYLSGGLGVVLPSRYLPRVTLEIGPTLIKMNAEHWSMGEFSRLNKYLKFKLGIALRQ